MCVWCVGTLVFLDFLTECTVHSNGSIHIEKATKEKCDKLIFWLKLRGEGYESVFKAQPVEWFIFLGFIGLKNVPKSYNRATVFLSLPL